MRRAAFFDFDKTLISCDSQSVEGTYLVKKRLFSLPYILRILRVVFSKVLYRRSLITPWKYNSLYVKTYYGIKRSYLEETAWLVYNEILKKKYIPEITSLLEEHRKKGDLIVIVSATSEHLIRPVKEDLAPDFIICTKLEEDENGICTGKIKGRVCIGSEKSSAVIKLAEREGIALEASVAYSDHHADIDFLRSVGRPVAVNPTGKLSELACNQGWHVIDTKKQA